MSDEPWQDDACSLVDALRSGERSPSEGLGATSAAIEPSDLDAFSHPHRAQAAAGADVALPFGGVPVGVKEFDQVEVSQWFDVCNGRDPREPLSLPRVDGWELGLGSHLDDLRGRRVAVVPDWGAAVVSPVMWELLDEAAEQLIADCGMIRVDGVHTELPRMGTAWSVANSVELIDQLRDHRPDCADDLTPEIRTAMEFGPGHHGAEARIELERRRAELNEAMARIFDPSDGGVDFVMTATNPDIAFAADSPFPDTFGGIEAGDEINGRLTFPANLHGNPAISIPSRFLDGLPIGLQVIGPHFSEELLFVLALTVERNRPRPLTTRAAHYQEVRS